MNNSMEDKISPQSISTFLDQYGTKIKYLSLDCFDTIIWRKTAEPRDVFYDLQYRNAFKAKGISASLRVSLEGKARQLNAFKNGSPEVKLKDIYLAGYPQLTAEELSALAEDELAAEMDICYGFYPMLELISKAAKLGIKLIVVSDTYFDENQLKRLLTHALPANVLSCISRVFCSCEHGVAKSSGLFVKVLQNIGCAPESVLHIGDNIAADFVAPRVHRIQSLHFIHHDDSLSELLRLEDTAAKVIDPDIRSSQPLYFPFRAVLAMQSFANQNPEKLLGYASLGQIMYAFAHFIINEIGNLKNEGKKPKVLFLMRDAYLPSMACETVLGYELGKRIRISRFAAYAASFLTAEDVDNYLIEIGNTNRFADVGRQLMLPEKVINPILKALETSLNPVEDFFKFIRRKDTMKIILNKSTEYRSRLIKHIQNEVGIEAGDTLVFVDLGYSGTAQRRLTSVFKEMDIEVVGRYLLALAVPGWESNRRGLIDPSWCDEKAIKTVVFYIMLLEQLCTSNECSVVDYDADGNAIYSKVMMSDQQQKQLALIQSEVLNFIRDAESFYKNTNTVISDAMFRQIALTELTRMIFFSTETELNFLQNFQAEMNLGTQDVLRVFDAEQGLTGLRRRGMFYMEKPSKLTRTNYPAELRLAGMELLLSLIAQHRYGLDLKLQDMVLRRESLPVLFRNSQETHKTSVDALATHDGFFSVWLPAHVEVAILLGEKYQWIQLESAELITMEAFVNQTETKNTTDIWNQLSLHHVIPRSADLFELTSRESAVIMKPLDQVKPNQYVFRLVFRPVVRQCNLVSQQA